MIPASMQRTDTVQLSGGEIKVHGLTMAQVHAIKAKGEGPDSDILTIVLAADLDHDTVSEWYKTASAGDVETIVRKTFELSRVDGAARFQDAPARDVGPQRA